MTWELYKGKTVELYVLATGHRWCGKCMGIADGFITIENDRDKRTLSFRLSEIETIREVRS
jgi:hypothetical protein